MSKDRWISEERICELERMGRLRDVNGKLARNTELADAWNKGDSGIGNVEPVSLTAHGLNKIDREAAQCREGGAVNQPAQPRSSGSPQTVCCGSGAPSATPLYPLVNLCRMAKISEPVPEHRFHQTRKWRFDYAFPLHMIAVEIEGGLWTNGRHSRGKGAIADIEKYSEAAILGWRILYATPQELDNGVCLDRIVRALTDREAA